MSLQTLLCLWAVEAAQPQLCSSGSPPFPVWLEASASSRSLAVQGALSLEACHSWGTSFPFLSGSQDRDMSVWKQLHPDPKRHMSVSSVVGAL